MKNKIILEFANEQDAKDVFQALSLKNEITWANDTRSATIRVVEHNMTVKVGQQTIHPPNPIKL